MTLISHRGDWAVCMPKKSGSHSAVKATAGIADHYGAWHGVDVPDGFNGERLMIVREPLDRITSIYWDMDFFWFEPRIGRQGWGDPSPAAWIDVYLRGEAVNRDWTVLQSELAESFAPDWTGTVDELTTKLGLPRERENVNPRPVSPQETWSTLFPSQAKRLDDWCERDRVGVNV